MAFRAVYATQEDVPEAIREHFVQGEDKKWRPEVEAVDGWAFEDVTALKSSLEHSKKETKDATGQAKRAEKENGTLTARVTELESAQSADEKAVEDRVNQVRTQLADTHQKEMEEAGTTIGQLTGQLEMSLIETAALQAMADPEIKGNPKLLLPIVKSAAKLEKGEDGQMRVVLYGPDGKTPKINGKAEPASFTDLLTEMRADPEFGGAFEGTSASGGNLPASTTPRSDGSYTAEQIEKMSQPEYEKARSEGKIT